MHGLPGIEVGLSAANWPDGWIRALLADDQRRSALLSLLGHAVAVTVEAISDPLRIVVSRRRQPSAELPKNALLWARYLGSIEVDGESRAILDSGGALFCLPPEVLVPGAPPQVGSAGVRFSRLWLHTDGEGQPRGGRMRDEEEPGELPVVIEGVFAAGNGFICRETGTSAFRWLHAELTGWCEASAADLGPHLRGRELRAALQPDGTISLVDAPAMHRLFDGLALGSTHRVEFLSPCADPARPALGRIHLSEAIVGIGKLEGQQKLTQGTSFLAEIAQRRPGGRPTVLLVPEGHRRITLDLPPSLVQAMRKLARWNPAFDGPAVVPELDRFRRYQEIFAAQAEPAGPMAETVIFAAKEALGSRGIPQTIELPAGLAEWRLAQENAEEIDLAPSLAACLLFDMHGAIDDDAGSAQTAVTYLHLIGRLAERSMHVEALATQWLGKPGMWAQPGEWERLRRVLLQHQEPGESIAALQELTDPGPIYDLARSVLERTDPREPLSDPGPIESAIAPMARGLLAAVGGLDNGDNLLRDAPVLTRLAGLGRGLTPANGEAAAQRYLLTCQRELLADLFFQVTRSGLPYVLLPLASA